VSSSLTQNAKLNFRKFASNLPTPSASNPYTTLEKALQGVKKTVALRRSKFSSKFPQKPVKSKSPHQSQISHASRQLVHQLVSHSSVTSATCPSGFVGHVGHAQPCPVQPQAELRRLQDFILGVSFPLLPDRSKLRAGFQPMATRKHAVGRPRKGMKSFL